MLKAILLNTTRNISLRELSTSTRTCYHYTGAGNAGSPQEHETRRRVNQPYRHYQHRSISYSPVHFAKEVEQDEDEVIGKGDKVLKLKLKTTRLDAVLKAGLNISRSKIEKAFYDDRLRVNGERAKKKSQMLDEGDEVDIVKGVNKLNPLFIDVSRVEIVQVGASPTSNRKGDSDDEGSGDEDSSDRIPAVLKRYKHFTIQNYPTPWKGNVFDDK